MFQNYTENEKQKLRRLSKLIEGFVEVGMEMLIATTNSKVIEKTDLASFLLFRQILESGDALSVLVSAGCVNTSKSQVRSLLEAYFQLAYLFKSNEARKALQLLYHYEKGKKEYYEKLAFPEKAGSFFEKLKKDKHLKGEDISDSQKKIYIDNIEKIEIILNEDGNKEIAKEYLRIEEKKKHPRTGKKGRVSHWYELFDGPASVEGVAVELDEASLYQFIYRSCSSYAHVEDIVHANLESYDDNSYKISALRDIRQLSRVVDNILLLIERSCMFFLKEKINDKRYFATKLFQLAEEKMEVNKNS